MLALKECLVREGVLNLTSTAGNGHGTGATRSGEQCNDSAADGTVAGVANNANTYRSNESRSDGKHIVGSNLVAISANHSANNRNDRNCDMPTAPAHVAQLAELRDQKSDDSPRNNCKTNNECQSEYNCSLTPASATAKSSCQLKSSLNKKPLQEKKPQLQFTQDTKRKIGSILSHYRCAHLQFHHHTAPAYYTDTNLHVHTPNAGDGASLNENYQCVYNTSSQLINERYFPKTSTATVAPPPIGTGIAVIGQAKTISSLSIGKRDRGQLSSSLTSQKSNNNLATTRGAFFRGGSAGSNGKIARKTSEPFGKSLPASGHPTKKGEFNDKLYTPFDVNHSSFVGIESSECSNYQIDHKPDIHKYNKSIPITSPTAKTSTTGSDLSSPSTRSRNTHRSASKKRTVRVRSESRPISALYDIICKEKGLDIGASTANEEDSPASPHDDKFNNNSENSHQSGITNNKTYSNIANCLSEFVAKSLSSYLSGESGPSIPSERKMNSVANLTSSAAGDTANERSKRSHKSRTPSDQLQQYKKRKDAGRLATLIMRNSSDNGSISETSENPREQREHATALPHTIRRTEKNYTMNGTEKASSLPPRLSKTLLNSTMYQQAQRSSGQVNLRPLPLAANSSLSLNSNSKCPIHCGCHSQCDHKTSNAHHPYHPYDHHQSSLPRHMSSGTCNMHTASTADGDSFTVSNSLGYSPNKLYIKPVSLNSISSSIISARNLKGSTSGVVIDHTTSTSSSRSNQRAGRVQQRRLREEKRRHTDQTLLSASPPAGRHVLLEQAERAASEDEAIVGITQQIIYTKRFINRPVATSPVGNNNNSNNINGSPHSQGRRTRRKDSPATLSSTTLNCYSCSQNGTTTISNILASLPPNTTSTSYDQHGIVIIEDAGSSSSVDHSTQVKLSPLIVMTNSAKPAAEVRAPANSCTSIDDNETHSADAELQRAVGDSNASVDVPVIMPAADALHQRKCDAYAHKIPSDTTNRTITKATMTVASGVSNCKPATVKHCRSQQQHNKHTSNNNTIKHINNRNSNYATPTETFLLKQKAKTLAGGEGVGGDSVSSAACVKKKSISSLLITPASIPTPTAHQLSHQHNARPHKESKGLVGRQSGQQPCRRLSPLCDGAPVSPCTTRSPLSPCSPHYVRPTKASQLRAAALDKKRVEDELLTQPRSPRYDSPASPRPVAFPKHRPRLFSPGSSSDNWRATDDSETDTNTSRTLEETTSTSRNDLKIAPVQHNRGEMNAFGSAAPTKISCLTRKNPHTIPCSTSICMTKLAYTIGGLSTNNEEFDSISNTAKPLTRPRTSTMNSSESNSASYPKQFVDIAANTPDLSPIECRISASSPDDRDKSSKRKSNLNRSLNDEATVDTGDSLAVRRRRRRELGMVRQLIPSDDTIIREMFLAPQVRPETTIKTSQTFESVTVEAVTKRLPSDSVACHNDTTNLADLRKLRSNDVNQKVNERTKSDLAEIRKIAEQANIEVAVMASGITSELVDRVTSEADSKSDDYGRASIDVYVNNSQTSVTTSNSYFEFADDAKERAPSPAKRATFVKDNYIYYDPPSSGEAPKSVSNTTMTGGILRQRMLKARSMERDAGHELPVLSPILRRRSTDDPSYISPPTNIGMSHNHIVSILKKKDHVGTESSSASSNASPVTFSANVVDTPALTQKRAGILKKRSSLDESRYYSRSHSPDERSILIKSARRNSLEETAGNQQHQQHGILKQSSYDSSKSDGCPSVTEPHPHGILKKKDSTSTPSDGGAHAIKHVSISQAVILAAAELGRETTDGQRGITEYEESGYTPINEDYEIRPILKLDCASSDDAMRPPKPILKKKPSGEHEIRPILKTSRKSSREEYDLNTSQNEDGRYYSDPPPPSVRPILKTESPSKRRSLGGEDLKNDMFTIERANSSSSLLKRRTRSLERQVAPVVDLAAALNAIATSQATPLEFASAPITTGSNISVAERIKSMEQVISNTGAPSSEPAETHSNCESPLQAGMTPRLHKPSAIRRDMYRDRSKTQPVTNDEKMLFKASALPLNPSQTTTYKSATSLDLNYTAFADLNPNLTQPLHSSQQFTAAVTASRVSPTCPTTQRDTITSYNSLSDIRYNSANEDFAISAESDSDRFFEMSGLDDNIGTTSTPSTTESNAFIASDVVDSGEGGDGDIHVDNGLTRRNSVRARANMFQQLQEKTKGAAAVAATAATALSREDRTPTRHAPCQLPSSPAAALTTSQVLSSSAGANVRTGGNEEQKRPNNAANADEEIEPTSLPVSERLRFFTNLAEAANRSGSNIYTRSPTQRFMSMERCGSANSYSNNYSLNLTPHNNCNGICTNTSGVNVTPVPMECCSPALTDPSSISVNDISPSLMMVNNKEGSSTPPPPPPPLGFIPNAACETSGFSDMANKPSSNAALPSPPPKFLAKPPSTAAMSQSVLTTTTRRFKMKTVGKIFMPQRFLNNNSGDYSHEYNSIETNSKPLALKKIGKIKSPFIENCLQMEQKHHQLNSKCMKYDHKSTPHNALAALENNVLNGGNTGERDGNSPLRRPLQNGNLGTQPSRTVSSEDSNADSGKENNYCSDATPLPMSVATSLSVVAEQPHSAVVEMRKKFTRSMNNSTLSLPAPTLSQQHTAHKVSRSVNSAPATPRNSVIGDKYAKYFGLAFNDKHYATTNPRPEREPPHTTAAHQEDAGARYSSLLPSYYCDSPTLEYMSMDTSSDSSGPTTPLQTVNSNVTNKQQGTPYYTPPTGDLFETPTMVMTKAMVATSTTSAQLTQSGSGSNLQKRRDMARRQRANTTVVTFTPTSSGQALGSSETAGMSSTGRVRALRSRALTLTNGVLVPEVKRFEDILVTKEEFQLASKEFERIFLGVI